MLLIITSCISPTEQNNLKLSEPNARLEFLIQGIYKMTKDGFFDKVILCDSSNYNLESCEAIRDIEISHNVSFEFLSFSGDEKNVALKGKGYGEGEIMKYIYFHSKLLLEEDTFVKITGRLYVDNIIELIKKIDKSKNYFNILNLKFLGAIDTRFYIINKRDYEISLLNAYYKVNDSTGKWYEVIFRDYLKSNKINFSFLPIEPKICGISGTHGKESFSNDINFKFKVLATRLGFRNNIIYSILSYILIKITIKIKCYE